VEVPIEALEIKKDGADIEECLQVMCPNELKEWIVNYNNQ
jgi:hypothetical protein